MALRTPRRRISPRTKRRCRAIKDFFRRALGNSSQPDIKINSSIAINISDWKHKIGGLEQHLSQVNKHYRDYETTERDDNSRRDSLTLATTEHANDLAYITEQTEGSSSRKPEGFETKILYKTSESHYKKSDDSFPKRVSGTNVRLPRYMPEDKVSHKKKKKYNTDPRLTALDASRQNLDQHHTKSAYENVSLSYSTNSYHSLVNARTRHESKTAYLENTYSKKRRCFDDIPVEYPTRHKYTSKDHSTRCRLNKSAEKYERYEPKHRSKTKKGRELDEEYIAEIIKRQYRPVKLFGRKESDISQFSAPVCRDLEYPVRENLIEGSELCSCCLNGRKKSRYECEHDLSDLHSICDTRLYSSKREKHHRHRRRHDLCNTRHNNKPGAYNDSELYDLIPVKEKPSPKPKRKVPVEEIITNNYYKEVPPSPRTLRPKLNLKAQYYSEFEEFMQYKKNLARKCSPQKYKLASRYGEPYESNQSSPRFTYPESIQTQRPHPCRQGNNGIQNQQNDTMSILRSPLFIADQANAVHEGTLNKTNDSDLSADKTDKALSEIKDILQSFLQEIKKESAASQSDNSDITNKNGDKVTNETRQDSPKLNTSMLPNAGISVNALGVPQCNMPTPCMPFNNPCCYPLFPVYPMNCMQNGYVMPSASFTCASCTNNAKDSYSKNVENPKSSENITEPSNETEQLIKEIYKFFAQSQNPKSNVAPDLRRKENDSSTRDDACNKEILTSRGVGGSSKFSKRDAQVGTQKIKCFSRSCEAIGSKLTSDAYNSRNYPTTYSDTVLDRLSLEVTATSSESEMSTESLPSKKHNRFAKVLRSLGLFKKKKDVIEELSESESTIEVDIKPKAPFRQEVTNYVMHGQEYYNRPPIPTQDPYLAPQNYHQGYGNMGNFGNCHTGRMQSGFGDCNCYKQHEHIPPYHSPRPHPTAPPHSNPYTPHAHPQVPLCLKEIEVKSIATQSDRKMNIFRKLTKKMHGAAAVHAEDERAKHCSTQTAGVVEQEKSKFGKFNWRSLQAKINELDKPDNLKFSMNTQKRLADGDKKIKNVMMRKLFYKRNPFSPRNLIVRTILGKDKSSFGEPPAMYRPRMFL